MSAFNGQFYGTPGYDPYNTQNNYINGYRNYMNMNPYSQNISIPQPQQNPQIGMQSQINNNMQFVLVPSIEVAQKATAEKGQTIYMMNQNKPEIYAKAADGFGLQTTKYFRLFEFDPSAEATAQSGQINENSYVTREEFNRLATVVSAEIENIKQTSLATANSIQSANQVAPQKAIASNSKKTVAKEPEAKND